MRMFKRADSKNETEVKKQDAKGRKRKIIFNMRVTEDERDQIVNDFLSCHRTALTNCH